MSTAAAAETGPYCGWVASEAGSQLSLTPGFREAKGNSPVPKHKLFPSPNDLLLGSLALTSGQFNSQDTISEEQSLMVHSLVCFSIPNLSSVLIWKDYTS